MLSFLEALWNIGFIALAVMIVVVVVLLLVSNI